MSLSNQAHRQLPLSRLVACTCALYSFTADAVQVANHHQSKAISDDELVQYLLRRKARKVSQT